ncbi:heterokaryon incompatibility protein-domain-containing protein [Penicillium nucicola]|uniref:heterokaryon incompatibility protein-domain-containing protein n=1 Tax=Penicillium nucicola TaxID=1850975 RepID=UPI00254545F3|nr:heterokaryon incompatibility protein-domain-containing protein [Penicillium nucicola]KAJ5753781.1 heterokaryon incompatibility protein-domain-containing protein [Penicillium nucicola]
MTQLHHERFDDLVASKEKGCISCNWLFDEYTLRNEGIQQKDMEGFHTTATKNTHSDSISFHTVVSWAVNFTVEVSVKSKPEVSRALDSRPWEKLEISTDSSVSIGQIESWLSLCDGTHKFCRNDDSTSFFPTRLIDVNEIEQGKVHLRNHAEIITQEGLQNFAGTETSKKLKDQCYAYWTLSHRWGDPKKILKLMHENEYQFKNGLSLTAISKTFQDAMWIVHRLNYRYIWIDCFCIFQDSIEDWQKEAAEVPRIYRNSFCNISAISSSYEPISTLFNDGRNPRLLFPFSLELVAENGQATYIINRKSLWKDEIENSPLSTRGWVVQERFLAPRIIHFGTSQIFWECLENTNCEADPDGRIGTIDDMGTNRLRSGMTAYKESLKELTLLSSTFRASKLDRNNINWERGYVGQLALYTERLLWRKMINIYTDCNLTEQSDRLIAMAGIAKAFHNVTLSTYLAGLWQHTLPADLLWQSNASDGSMVQRQNLYVPSWSWASVFGGSVSIYAYTRFGGDAEPKIELIASRLESLRPGGDLMGLLRRAELEIKCVLLYYRWNGNSQSLDLFANESRTQPAFHGGRIWGRHLRLDTYELVQKFKHQLFIEGECIPITVGREAYGSSTCKFLVVENASGRNYRRVGVYEVGEQGAHSVIDGKERTVVTLV